MGIKSIPATYTRKSAPKVYPPPLPFSLQQRPPTASSPPLPSFSSPPEPLEMRAHPPTHYTDSTLLLLWLHGRPLRPTREPVLFPPRQPDLDHKKEGGEGGGRTRVRDLENKSIFSAHFFFATFAFVSCPLRDSLPCFGGYSKTCIMREPPTFIEKGNFAAATHSLTHSGGGGGGRATSLASLLLLF